MIEDHYTVKLRDGKYTLIRRHGQALELLRHNEPWPGADDLRFCNVLIAAVERIRELEESIKAVLDGSLIYVGHRPNDARNDDGMKDFAIAIDRTDLPAYWEQQLRKVLEQK